ncbi:MAG: glutamyl-tRNA reductase [Methanobacteriaceae archaeon]|uniref:glutamyl-tRNA reductase n=1 Tax=Methanobrevibacter TaxID=2172 RepID=UPI003764B248|nr:glutamyl-tRNA reductase [Methanobacteriaceae archaeon]MDD4593501.1 glutamyl-tRNA reductase [Methanobacteriaceae archaeon]
MIINIGVDHKIADIETMEIVSNDLKNLFNQLKEKYDINEYVEISTCNRYEYYIHDDFISYDEPLLDHDNKNIIIQYGDDSIIHLFRMTSGLESMIVGEDQILGQIKDSKKVADKENHCGKILDTIFLKAIHVGQEVRQKTMINQGSVSIGSAAVDLAEEIIGDLRGKCVLVIGAGEMGTLVAKAIAEKDLKAIFVANRTYFRANRLAKELGGESILIDDIGHYLANADVVISATGAPHYILTKERVAPIIEDKNAENILMIDIANPRDIDEDVKDLNVNLLNIDDLRGVAEKNKALRKNESEAAEKIISEEFDLLENSFKLMKVEDILRKIRSNMEDIRQRESEKAIVKLADSEGSVKIIDNLTKSIVNKIFYDISVNIKNAAEDEDEYLINAAEKFFINE